MAAGLQSLQCVPPVMRTDVPPTGQQPIAGTPAGCRGIIGPVPPPTLDKRCRFLRFLGRQISTGWSAVSRGDEVTQWPTKNTKCDTDFHCAAARVFGEEHVAHGNGSCDKREWALIVLLVIRSRFVYKCRVMYANVYISRANLGFCRTLFLRRSEQFLAVSLGFREGYVRAIHRV